MSLRFCQINCKKNRNAMLFLSSRRLLSQRRKKSYFDFSVNCTGNEAHLTGCRMGKALEVTESLNATCANGMPAVISCVPGRAFAPTHSSGFRKAYRAEVYIYTHTDTHIQTHVACTALQCCVQSVQSVF